MARKTTGRRQPSRHAMPGRPQRQLEDPSSMIESFKTALDCNRRLQEELRQNLEEIRKRQVANRKRAATIRQEVWEQTLENNDGIGVVEPPRVAHLVRSMLFITV